MKFSREPTDDDHKNWMQDPNNWRLRGFIYFNPKDKRLIVPKRIQWMGLTINFAHPMAFALTLFTILWIVFLGILPTLFRSN